MTPRDKPLRRELQVDDRLFTRTRSPEGLKLVPKGHRNGIELERMSPRGVKTTGRRLPAVHQGAGHVADYRRHRLGEQAGQQQHQRP